MRLLISIIKAVLLTLAALGLCLCAVPRATKRTPPPPPPEPVTRATEPHDGGGAMDEGPTEEMWATNGEEHAPPPQAPQQPRRRVIPSTPFKGQKKPPCDRDLVQEEINGACWEKVDRDAPCGPKLYEYRGGCYKPVRADPKVPVALEDAPRE